MNVALLPLVHTTVVEAGHLDRFGHVNVMWYTHFFDSATLALFERMGCGPSYYESSGHGMFALEQHTRYLRELREGDAVELFARVLGVSAKRIHFMLFLSVGGPESLSATSELLGMHIDLGPRRAAPFPPEVFRAISRTAAEHQALGWAAPVCGAIEVSAPRR